MQKMQKMLAVLRNALIALNQFGVEYDTHTYGSGPKVVKREEALDFIQQNSVRLIDWAQGDAAADAESWLTRPSLDGRKLHGPAGSMAAALEAECAVIILTRLIEPSEEDYAAYTVWCGCDTYEEAQACGDLQWGKDFLAIQVRGDQLEGFLRLAVPYCWG